MAVRGRANKELVQRLQAVPLFSACSARELAAVARSLKEVNFPAGRSILTEGNTSAAALHVILDGQVNIVGGGRTRARLGPGSFFGEVALLDPGPRTASVVADGPVRTLALSAWAFRGVLREHPTIAIKLLEELARRLRTAEPSTGV